MTIAIAEIEDAITEAIRTSETLGGYCKTIDTYAGQLEEDVEQMVIRFPACFVMFVEALTRPLSNREQEKDLTWSLLVADHNLRGNIAARRGAGMSTGAYTMLQDLQALLIGHRLGLGITPLMLVSETAVLNTRRMAIYDAQYRTQIRVSIAS